MKNPLQKVLDENNITVLELSEKLNISQTAIYSWMRGDSAPSRGNAKRLANAMGLSRLEFRKKWTQWEEQELGEVKFRKGGKEGYEQSEE